MNGLRITWLDQLWLLVVAVTSFLFFGAPFYRFLDSDAAVHVLMTNDFSFQQDLYYWAQDRLGSLVPMLAFLVKSHTSFRPIWVYALVKWAVLLAGVAVFWLFIPTRWQRWAFAVAWFFPIYELRCLLLPGHPYGEQMTLLAVAFFSFDRAVLGSNRWWLPVFVAMAALSVWVSDFSVLFFLVGAVFFRREVTLFMANVLRQRQWLLMVATALVACFCAFFIAYAKLHAMRDPSYINQLFASGEQLSETLRGLWFYATNVATCASVSPWNSVLFYAVIALGVVLAIYRNGFGRWARFFLLSFLAGFALLACLRWVSINGVMLKYFIPAFYVLWLALFSFDFSAIKTPWLKSTAAGLVAVFVIASACSLFDIHQKRKERAYSLTDIEEIKHDRKRFFMSEYWHSYLLAMAYPDAVVATPHDKDFSRNEVPFRAVMAADTIIVVKNHWLETAPDTMSQFGYTLVKTGQEWSEGKFDFAAYRNLGRP